MQIRKKFESAYILDEAKLRRIFDVISGTFTEIGSEYNIRIIAKQPQHKETTVNSPEQLLLLDNSKKYPIESIIIVAGTIKDDKDENVTPSHYCMVAFSDSEYAVSVRHTVQSSDINWANNCGTLIVEQLERTLQSGWIAKLNASFSRHLISFSAFLLLALGSAGLLFLLTVAPDQPSLSWQLWLTDNNIEQITNSEQPVSHSEVLDMQIKNIQQYDSRPRFPLLKDWRIYAAFSPVIIVLFCLIYLVRYCYPPAVFNWGDMGDHYEILLSRRKILWSAIIIGVFVGLLANLAVYGLVDLVNSKFAKS